ncbi:MAG: PilX N-terminal domain-containing pilus assembly protein [Methyloglobulus sp.]
MASTPVLYKSQSGVVLIISLIMLLLLTLVGLTGMQNIGLEEKMAGNMRDSNLAFQAAESALVAGEAASLKKPAIAACPGVNPVGLYKDADANCDGTKDVTSVWKTISWATNSIEYPGNADVLGKLSAKPRYIIEELDSVCRDSGGTRVIVTPCVSPNTTYKNYRITAKGTGGTESAVVLLQSTYEVKS